MTDEPEVKEEAEEDPYESFTKSLEAARVAVDKALGIGKKKDEPPSTMKDASRLAREVFAQRRKAAQTTSK